MQPLRLPGTLNERQWEDVIRLTRRWYVWPIRFVGESHAYAFLYVAAAGVLAVLLYPAVFKRPAVLLGILSCFLLGAGMLWLSERYRRYRRRRSLRKYNSHAVAGIIRDDGVVFPDATSVLIVPWASYRSAILTGDVLILFMTNQHHTVRVFCIAAITPAEREALLACLRHNLGPDNTKEAPIRRSRLRPNVVRQP